MNLILQMTLCACFTGIAIAVADMLKPNDKFDKQLKVIFAVMLSLSILLPFSNADFQIPLPEKKNIKSESEIYTSAALNNAIENNIGQRLKESLALSGISSEKIDVKIHISDNSGISISEVKINTSNNQQAIEIICATLEIGAEKVNEF